MKARIFIAFAALALAVVAVPVAQAWWHTGPDVDQRLSGSTHVVDVDESGNTTSLLLLQAKGQRGKANATGRIFWGPLVPDERCHPEFPLGADIISLEWVETYSNGSLLTGNAPEGGLLCATFEGLIAAEIHGDISGGTGRFEGASGIWTVVATTPAENQGITGTLTADLY